MSSSPKDEELRAASKTPAYRKVRRVAPEQSPVTPCAKEPDPELGHGLIRKERYTTPEFMQLEWERIWKKVWLLGAVESDLREPGDFVATEIGRESVLIVRQADGSVRALLQRVPAPRQPAAAHGRRQRRLVQVPVPSLGLRARRLVQAHSRPRHVPAGCPALPWPQGTALRGVGRLRLVQPRPGRGSAARVPRPGAPAPRAVPLRQDGAHPRHHRRVELQLEGVGGRVQRELSRAGHPPAAHVVPARPGHPDRLLRAPQPLPDPVRDAGARACAGRRRFPTRSR